MNTYIPHGVPSEHRFELVTRIATDKSKLYDIMFCGLPVYHTSSLHDALRVQDELLFASARSIRKSGKFA